MDTDTKAVLKNLKKALEDSINTIVLHEHDTEEPWKSLKGKIAETTMKVSFILLEDSREVAKILKENKRG